MSAGAGADKVLTTDASGVASWQAPAEGVTSGGSTGYVQFNDEGAFGADSNLFWDNINKRLGIGTSTPSSSAKVDISSTNSGLLLPRMTSIQRDAISSPDEGLLIFNTSANRFEVYYTANWHRIRQNVVCPSSVSFTYKGGSVTYGTVMSQAECWLDRNLGASQVATAWNDANAYGDLFEWGRLDDGHQSRDSGLTTTLSSTDDPGHSNYIYGPSPGDWRSPPNDNLWQGVSGINNPCPPGWRLPTSSELAAERASWSTQDAAGAFGSPLKLTAAGCRWYYSAGLYGVGCSGAYWSSDFPDATHATWMKFGACSSGFWNSRSGGASVRCIKD